MTAFAATLWAAPHPQSIATPGPCDLRLPDWAFVAWLTWRERTFAAPATALPPRLEAEMAMRRLARRLGDSVL